MVGVWGRALGWPHPPGKSTRRAWLLFPTNRLEWWTFYLGDCLGSIVTSQNVFHTSHEKGGNAGLGIKSVTVQNIRTQLTRFLIKAQARKEEDPSKLSLCGETFDSSTDGATLWRF